MFHGRSLVALAPGADQHFLVAGFEFSAGDIDVGLAHGAADVIEAQAIASHRFFRYIDGDFKLGFALDGDLGDRRRRQQFVAQVLGIAFEVV